MKSKDETQKALKAEHKAAIVLREQIGELRRQAAEREKILALYKAHLSKMRRSMTPEQELMFAASDDWEEDVESLALGSIIDVQGRSSNER